MPAITHHPKLEQPSDISIPVWRYMDLPKYVAMLQAGALYFPRLDYLGDPLEGSISKLEVERLEAIVAEHEGKIVLPPGASHFDILVGAVRRTRFEAYANCWHMNFSESEAMWKLYGASDSAIAVRSTYQKLTAALPSDALAHPAPYVGVVKYSDFETELVVAGNVLELCMQKRASFAHERECRALVWMHGHSGSLTGEELTVLGQRNPVGLSVQVDLSSLIEAVVVSPLAPRWFMDVVKDVTAKYGYDFAHTPSSIRRVPYI